MSVVVSVSIDIADLSFISEHTASKHGLDMASFLLESALERKDPVTYTMKEAMEMLDV